MELLEECVESVKMYRNSSDDGHKIEVAVMLRKKD